MRDTFHPLPELGTWGGSTSRDTSQRAAERYAVLTAVATRAEQRPRTPWFRRPRPPVTDLSASAKTA